MREMLFKAKRVDNGEWVEGLPIRSHIGFSSRIDTIQYAFGGYLPTHKIDPETLCEYTGLKDKITFEDEVELRIKHNINIQEVYYEWCDIFCKYWEWTNDYENGRREIKIKLQR